MSKLVSVIIPTYNRCNLLARAIDSVISQSYHDIEIIVISDNSTDDTNEYMKKYDNNPSVIFKINDKCYGANYSRNLGISLAKGDYIAFLDDDDEWTKDKLKKQVELLESNNDCGICFTMKKCIYHFKKNTYFYFSLPCYSNEMNNILISNFIGTNSSVMVRKDLLNDNKYDDSMPALQDWDLWIRLLKISKVCCINEPLVIYYTYLNNQNLNGHISTSVDKYLKAYSIINNKYKDEIESISKKENKNRRISKNHDLAERYMRNNFRLKAFSTLLKSSFQNLSIKEFILSFGCLFSYEFIVKVKAKNNCHKNRG